MKSNKYAVTARSNSVNLKSAAKLSAVIGLVTEHADCHLTFEL